MNQDKYISWDTIHSLSQTLGKELLKLHNDWKGIVAITRGGMVPACIVAREMDLSAIETFCISTYTDRKQDKHHVSKNLHLPDGGRGWIVLDDLADSGNTMNTVRDSLPNAFFATLYAKPAGAPATDMFLEHCPQEVWLHFPWEVDADSGHPQGK